MSVCIGAGEVQRYGASGQVRHRRTEVDFNGHRVSAAGICPLTSNVKAIQAIPVPIKTKQLLRVVCTASYSYYLKFVPDFAEICEPQRQLLKVDAVWN